MGTLRPSAQYQGEPCEENDLIRLDRMPCNAVAEVHAPGQSRGLSVRIVRQAGQEASDPPNADAETKGQGEEIAGAGADTLDLLDDFDGNPSAKKASDDSLSAARGEPLRQGDRRPRRLLQHAKHAAADQRTDHRRRNHTPALPFLKHIASVAARGPVCAKPKRIAQRFKDRVQFGVGREVEHDPKTTSQG